MVLDVTPGQPLPQPEASRSRSTLQPSLPPPSGSAGWTQEKPLGGGVFQIRGGRALESSVKETRQPRYAAGEETPTADQEEQRRCAGPAQARGGGSTCVPGPWRPPSARPDALAPPAPRSGRACPRVSPHRAIGPAADVGRGHVGLGQLPGGLVDVLLVEALFPGEAHPAHTIPAAPVRRLRSLPARFPAPGPLPRSLPLPLPPRSSPARGRGRPAARPTCPFAQVRRRPGLPRQPSP